MKYSRFNVWAELGDHVGLFGGVSGAFVVMDPEQRRQVDGFVAGADTGTAVADLLHQLVEMGIIVNDDHDELAVLRSRYDAGRWHSDSLGYTVVTSLGCNFDCPYCFEAKHPSLLKPAVADALVEVLQDSLPSINRMHVTWMGGEPLLGKKQLLDLSDRFIEICDANDKTYAANIITNGWHLDRATARALVERRVEGAQVTIDGPPDVHDVKRPLVNGGSTFGRIVDNVVEASEEISIGIRINLDTTNAHRAEELVAILAGAGLAGRVTLALGKISNAVGNEASPLATYTKSCMTAPEFGAFEMAFNRVAESYGFGYPGTPGPVGTPCTAVRAGEIVAGSDGEMWKCWDDIGDADRSIGTVFDYRTSNEELQRWLAYHPVDDAQCSTCIALPVCMGGCVHHDFNSDDREARCGTFRHNHAERIEEHLRRTVGMEPGPVPALPRYDAPAAVSHSTPVSLSPRRVPT